MKLTLYLFWARGLLGGALVMYWQAGQTLGTYTFDMLQLEQATPGRVPECVVLRCSSGSRCWAASAVPQLVADGHVAARRRFDVPRRRADETGRFAALRLDHAAARGRQDMVWLIMLCAGVAVVYGAYIAFVQSDFKYSSVSSCPHGLVMLGSRR